MLTNMMSLILISLAELREAISPCIPKLMKWLESTSWRVLQIAAVDALSELVEHGQCLIG